MSWFDDFMQTPERAKEAEVSKGGVTDTKDFEDRLNEACLESFNCCGRADYEAAFKSGANWAKSELQAELTRTQEALKVALVALEKIDDPRKRDHTEPDDYTRLGCVMNIATEALLKIKELKGGV